MNTSVHQVSQVRLFSMLREMTFEKERTLLVYFSPRQLSHSGGITTTANNAAVIQMIPESLMPAALAADSGNGQD